jgi:hypothetical protein
MVIETFIFSPPVQVQLSTMSDTREQSEQELANAGIANDVEDALGVSS